MIAIEGAVTSLCIPPIHVLFTYKDGEIISIEGDKIFLD